MVWTNMKQRILGLLFVWFYVSVSSRFSRLNFVIGRHPKGATFNRLKY